MDFRAMAEAVQPEVVAFRRDLHEHPEASFQEFRTTEQIAKEMVTLQVKHISLTNQLLCSRTVQNST